MQARQARTITRGQVLVDEIYRSPVDEHLERARARILAALLAITALLLLVAYW
jgi:hypothetical protein